MKTLKNLFYMLLVLAVGGFSACTEDETTDGQYGEGVYFATNQQTEYMLESAADLEVPVYRTNAGGELTVDIIAEVDEDAFTVPYDVTFAAGEKVAVLKIKVNGSKIDSGKTYNIALELVSDGNLDPYGLSKINLTAMYDPWTLLGKGYYRDAVVGEMFGATVGVEREVEIWQSDLDQTVYRMPNVYDANFVSAIFGMDMSMYFVFTEANLYFIIDEENKAGFIPWSYDGGQTAGFQKMGIEYSGYGPCVMITYSDDFFRPEDADETWEPIGLLDAWGTYDPEKKTITFPEESIAFIIDVPNSDQDPGALLNISGMTRIVMPGGSNKEPAIEASLAGLTTDAEGVRYASFKATMNRDAAHYRWMIVEGDLTLAENAARAEELVADLIAGECEYMEVRENGETRAEYPRAGQYSAIFVPFADNDLHTAGPAQVVPFLCENTAVAVADFDLEIEVAMDQTSGVINLKPNSSKLYYFWDYMTKEFYQEEILDKGFTIENYIENFFQEQLEAYNTIGYDFTLEDVIAMYSYQDEAEVELPKLEAETDYIYFSYCLNQSTGLPRSAVRSGEFSTVDLPEMTEGYANWLGKWTVLANTSVVIKDGSLVRDNKMTKFDIEVKVNKANESYYVVGWAPEIYEVYADTDLVAKWNEQEGQFAIDYSAYLGAIDYYEMVYAALIEFPYQGQTVIDFDMNFEDFTQSLNIPALYGRCTSATRAKINGGTTRVSLGKNMFGQEQFVDAQILTMTPVVIDMNMGQYRFFQNPVKIPATSGSFTLNKVEEESEAKLQPTAFRKAGQMLEEAQQNSPKAIRADQFAKFNRVLAE